LDSFTSPAYATWVGEIAVGEKALSLRLDESVGFSKVDPGLPAYLMT
jgi:hypothetical protein